MKTRTIVILTLSLIGLIGLGIAYKKYGSKKPCACMDGDPNASIIAAINKMNEEELKLQIVKSGSKIRLDGKSEDELRQILISLTIPTGTAN